MRNARMFLEELQRSIADHHVELGVNNMCMYVAVECLCASRPRSLFTYGFTAEDYETMPYILAHKVFELWQQRHNE